MSDSVNVSSEHIPSSRKRPIAVWVITVYFSAALGWTVLSLLLVLSNRIPLNDVQKDYMASFTWFDYGLTALLTLTNIIAVVLLFLLRRQAFHFFVATLIINVLFTTYHAATTNWLKANGRPGLVGMVMAVAVGIALIFYSRMLIRRGTLK